MAAVAAVLYWLLAAKWVFITAQEATRDEPGTWIVVGVVGFALYFAINASILTYLAWG